MKTKYTELKATELIETTGGVNVLFNPLYAGGGGVPVFVGGGTTVVHRPDHWDVYTDPGRKRRP
ncbi:hypothetical protein [Streptococcus fryi]